MDILLVNAPVKTRSKHARLNPPLGLAYIASVLLKNGYRVAAEDFNVTGFNPFAPRGFWRAVCLASWAFRHTRKPTRMD